MKNPQMFTSIRSRDDLIQAGLTDHIHLVIGRVVTPQKRASQTLPEPDASQLRLVLEPGCHSVTGDRSPRREEPGTTFSWMVNGFCKRPRMVGILGDPEAMCGPNRSLVLKQITFRRTSSAKYSDDLSTSTPQ